MERQHSYIVYYESPTAKEQTDIELKRGGEGAK